MLRWNRPTPWLNAFQSTGPDAGKSQQRSNACAVVCIADCSSCCTLQTQLLKSCVSPTGTNPVQSQTLKLGDCRTLDFKVMFEVAVLWKKDGNFKDLRLGCGPRRELPQTRSAPVARRISFVRKPGM
eukprot:s1890_g6.t1